jgi:hypothetical protein
VVLELTGVIPSLKHVNLPKKTSGGGKAGACTWLNDYVYEFDLMSLLNEDVEIVSYVESDMAVYEDGHWKFKNQFGDCYRQILSKQIQID